MSLLEALFVLGEGVLVGWFCTWICYADRAGRYHIPESVNDRSGWIHDGTLYVAQPSAGIADTETPQP